MSNEESKKKCPYCGAEVNEEAKKCPNCKKWIEKKELSKGLIIAIIVIVAFLGVVGCSCAYYNRPADSCFNENVQEDVMNIFKDKAEWKASKEEHLYYGGKQKTTMSEPEVKFVEPLSYDKGINKYTCSARIEVKSEVSTKYSGESEKIERSTEAYDFAYSSYRMPNGVNSVIGHIDSQWTK